MELLQLGERPDDISAITIDLTDDDFDADVWVSVQRARFDSVDIGIGSDLEFPDHKFCRVIQILKNKQTGLHRIRGFSFLPLSKMGALFDRVDNEVYWDLKSIQHGVGSGLRQQVQYDLHDVIRKRKIVVTNLALELQPGSLVSEEGVNVRTTGELYCRWKVVQQFEAARSPKACGYLVHRLCLREVRRLRGDRDKMVIDLNLRHLWRDVVDGPGSTDTMYITERVQSLSLNDGVPVNLEQQQYWTEALMGPAKYTFADMFSGCGGASRAALQANLMPVIACDMDPLAMHSHRTAFAAGILRFQMPVDQFINYHPQKYQVDIAHFSPPCQVFSKCHTTAGQNDDANYAASFCIAELLEKLKPRVVTMENTSGLSSDHKEVMIAILNQFVRQGYSISWGILNAADYGVPQVRKRLILIGTACVPSIQSCYRSPSFDLTCIRIGEAPLQLPRPTHAQHGTASRPRWTTIRDAIYALPANAMNHQPSPRPKGHWPKPRRSWDTQARTITTVGGTSYHPSGDRHFTPRELACLQTFPIDHRFANYFAGRRVADCHIKRQVGNAVPPAMFSHLYRWVAEHLAKTDRAWAALKALRRARDD